LEPVHKAVGAKPERQRLLAVDLSLAQLLLPMQA